MAKPERDSGMENLPTNWQSVKEGWYESIVTKLNLTTRKLDIVLVVCAVIFVISMVIGYMGRGYTVEFNSTGGTMVESQEHQYGDLIVAESPTREGFTFTGWYKDPLFENRWDMSTDTVEGNTTLYAGWEENPG